MGFEEESSRAAFAKQVLLLPASEPESGCLQDAMIDSSSSD